jgi:hypothetical protein
MEDRSPETVSSKTPAGMSDKPNQGTLIDADSFLAPASIFNNPQTKQFCQFLALFKLVIRSGQKFLLLHKNIW